MMEAKGAVMTHRKITNKNLLFLRKYLIITVGSILMGLSNNLIFEPMELVTGGVSGLAIVVKALTNTIIAGGIPVWLFTVLANIPLFLISAKVKGVKFLFSAIYGTVAYILSMMLLPIVDLKLGDYLLASIMGGALGGIGIGLVFSVQASTGGTDLLANIIQYKNKHMSIPVVMTCVDGVIIFIGALVFGLGHALYAIISVFIVAKVSDGILEGLKYAKMAYIISDEYAKIAEAILHQMDRGVTGVSATGMYSNTNKKMLFCVVSKKEIVKITEIAQRIDPKSFVIVSDVREVMGEGFIEYRQ
ncbi:MAG TPA: YitT family protein [Mobilitalea sp.]|nr:YitT family protein [Mobilitalea sp.]